MAQKTSHNTQKKLTPIDIFLLNHFTRVTLLDKIFFLDHLRTMLRAGLSLIEGLDVLVKETRNKRLARTLEEIHAHIEKGNQFSESLARYPAIFPDMYITMISSGEVAGKLEDALEQAVTQMKKSHALASSIRGAMIYPAVVVSAMLIIGVLMVTMVLPKLTSLFDQFDAQLPLATRILIALTNFLSKPINLIIIFAALFSLIAIIIILIKKNKSFRRGVHRIILHTPIVGPIAKKINLARFSVTLSSLLKSTIPIVEAVGISGKTCKNIVYQEALENAKQVLTKGEQLSQALASYPKLFPPMVTEMIMVGERTGEIGHLLGELTSFYSDEVDKTMKNFSTIIEPVVIILLGLGVAGIAVAVVMPMFTLIQNF